MVLRTLRQAELHFVSCCDSRINRSSAFRKNCTLALNRSNVPSSGVVSRLIGIVSKRICAAGLHAASHPVHDHSAFVGKKIMALCGHAAMQRCGEDHLRPVISSERTTSLLCATSTRRCIGQGDGARKSAAPVAIAFCGVALKPASQGSCVLDEKRQCRPDVADDIRTRFSDSVVGQPDGMICFLHLERMFGREDKLTARAA
ncbi:hypothetical protein FHT77_004136 [Rhizobium sp. BK181]|nr:hypothetical protein [Rhizobium sp. BK181]